MKYDARGHVLDTRFISNVVGVGSEPSRKAGSVEHVLLSSSLRGNSAPRQLFSPPLVSAKTATNGKKIALPS